MDALTLPPAPLQIREYDGVPADAEVMISLPLVFFAPFQAPTAVHVEALVDDHASVEFWPLITDDGLNARVTVGAAGGGFEEPPHAARATAKNTFTKTTLDDMRNSLP